MNNMNPSGMVVMNNQMGNQIPQQQMGGPPQGMPQGGMPPGGMAPGGMPPGAMNQGGMPPQGMPPGGLNPGMQMGGMQQGGMPQGGMQQNPSGQWNHPFNSMPMANQGPVPPMGMAAGPPHVAPGAQQGPGSQGPPSSGPPQQAQPPGPAPMDAQRNFDNVGKVRALVNSLKDSLSDVVRVAAMNIYQTAAVDNGMRASSEGPPPRLDKALEDFFSICNQIEFNLKTIQECALQFRDSQQYLPVPVQLSKADNSTHQDNTMSYSQYIATIGAQVAFAKQVQEILSDYAVRMQQQQQQSQPMFHQ